MIVSDSVGYAEVYAALEAASEQLGRKVNPTIYHRAGFAQALRDGSAFVTRVVQQPKLWLIGSDDVLAA